MGVGLRWLGASSGVIQISPRAGGDGGNVGKGPLAVSHSHTDFLNLLVGGMPRTRSSSSSVVNARSYSLRPVPAPELDLDGSRGMMVLFEKQVHLQNEVGAKGENV